MSKSSKICIIGTHGCGKSTLSYSLGAFYKEHGKNVTVINETVRGNPFGINDEFNTKGFEWCVTKHILRELESEAQGYEIIISDRSPYDSVIYAIQKKLKAIKPMVETCATWMMTYDKIIFITDISDEILGDGVRSEDLEFRKEIYDLFSKYLLDTKGTPMLNTVLKIPQERIFKEMRNVCVDIDNFRVDRCCS